MTLDQPCTGTDSWVERLISPSDRDLDGLAHATFIDAGERFSLGAGDQSLVAAAYKYIGRRDPGPEVLVLALPRGERGDRDGTVGPGEYFQTHGASCPTCASTATGFGAR